jgi:tryptophanyl-tRNA synthetase
MNQIIGRIYKMENVLSGMRPTGKLHLGHLHGVLENWKELQEQYKCFYFAADWHALTSEYKNTEEIRENIYEMVADWLSVGIDPEKSTIFIQSHIKEHAELHLLLSMITPIGWLERNPSYKELKTELKNKDINTYGFLGYPVLQTADIIIYKARYVPIGMDQLPHLELSREIVRRFNFIYKKDVFIEPEPLFTKVNKLTGTDGRKMSKSYGNAIYISDEGDILSKKILNLVTDTQRVRRKDPGEPEKCFAFEFHKIYCNKEELSMIREECPKAGIGCFDCKKILLKRVEETLSPIQEKRKSILKNKDLINDILEKGDNEARKKAIKTMEEVRNCMFIDY